ncbi:MAG: hypothetical protein WCG27_12210, partial [Pseudomonadota bacterium]
LESKQFVSVQSLIANGISQEKAKDYFHQNQELAKRMEQINKDFQIKNPEQRLVLKVGKKDTKASLAKDIVGVYPQATKEFVDFYTTQIMAL